jgi:surfeit locus 1 family protein
MTTKFSLPFSLVLFSLLLICIFVGLGTWQLKRKEEKEALLHALATAWEGKVYNVDEVPNPPLMKPLFAEGQYLPGTTLFLQSKTHQGKSGVYVLEVFKTQKGKFLLVQRGWAPKEYMPPALGTLKITGIGRLPSPPTYFQPLNQPPLYFWIDLNALSKELNLPLLPYYLVAKDTHDPHILPTEAFPPPRNNHLGYALTWYGLAFSLVLMLLWSFKRRAHKEQP